MTQNPLGAYRQTRVKTASQGQLIVMLYDEAIRQIEIAERELAATPCKLDVVHNAIVKAQDIITELTASLDFEKGGELAQNLFRLYMFFNRRLVDSNMAKEPTALREVRELMSELRAAWGAISSTAAPEGRKPPSGVNIAG